MNLILFGYRGCGKTTLGKKLAAQLWKDFADGDAKVRQRFGNRSIADIWATDGEPAFRETEAEVTAELCNLDNHVIALGGGALMHADARQAVKHAPDTVRIYLSCEPAELHRRIHADTATTTERPDLTGLGGGIEEVTKILEDRDPIYRDTADHVFNVTHTNPDQAALHIVSKFL